MADSKVADSGRRGRRRVNRARVQRVERLTPHMIRVVLGGEELDGFGAGEYTDHYIKLLFPAGGGAFAEPPDIHRIREELPREQWPRTRTYTVRRWDPVARELWVDIVHHGEGGLAGRWAAQAEPGDRVYFLGPGGGYAPDPAADWHLLAGDESALPAIAATLERLPRSAQGYAFVEVAGPAEEQAVDAPAGVRLRWLDRAGRPAGAALVEAVRALPFPVGTPQVFVHGEAGCVRQLRGYLRLERGLGRERLSASGYWRLGADEDGWQAAKREWNRQVEAEQDAAPGR